MSHAYLGGEGHGDTELIRLFTVRKFLDLIGGLHMNRNYRGSVMGMRLVVSYLCE